VKNFIVYRSSAGSGKTYALAVNYISLALSKGPHAIGYYKKILAITFTNKAAKEMKERVLHYLYVLSQKQDTDNILSEIISKTNLSEEEIYIKSKDIYSHIIHNYSDLGIQTIDKFTYKIVKTFSSDLGMSSDFDLELDSAKIIQPVVALLISRISNKNKELSSVLVDFSLQKVEDGVDNNIQSDLEDFCAHLFSENLDNLSLNNTFSLHEYVKIKDKLYNKRNDCFKKILVLRGKVIKVFVEHKLSANHFNRGTFYKLFTKKLLSKKCSDWIPTETLVSNVDEGNWYKTTLDEQSKISVDQCQVELKDLFDNLLDLLKDYITLDSILKKIYPSLIINQLIKEVKEYKQEHNIQHISSFNQQIHELVTSQSSSFIFERLGERYNHFLIDEFQDTSLLQWQNLLPLITDSLDFGKTFIVGDGKQSIYRWRSGEVEQFLNLPKIFKGTSLEYLNEWQAKLDNHYLVENLQENFRSKKEIINFNNKFFTRIKQVLPAHLIGIYDNHNQSSTYAKEGGYVHLELFDGNDYKKEVLSSIKNEIKRLLVENNYKYKDIAILCNKNSEIGEIAEYLSSYSIPIVSNEGLLISKSKKVKVLMSFVKYVQNIENNFAKTSIITYLHSLGLFKESLHSFNLNLHDNDKFIAALNSINIKIDVHYLLQLSLYEMIIEIIASLNIKYDIYVDFFTDLVHTYSQKNFNSLSDFILWWEDVKEKKSISISEDTDAVKLMTIHKSKGLAFNVVMIPFNFEISGTQEMWVKNNDFISDKLTYSLINRKNDLLSSHFSHQYKDEEDLSLLDNINKLYVAVTRAKESLYVFSKLLSNKSKSRKRLNYLLSQFSSEYPFLQGDRTKQHVDNIKYKNSFIKEDVVKIRWRDIISLKNSSLEFWDVETNDVKKDWGKLLHYTLSKIYFIDQTENVIQNLFVSGKCSFEEKNKLNLEINKLFSDSEVRYFFSKEWEIKTEKEILMQDGKTYIPDRLLINDSEVIIVDYKTGVIDNKHNIQLANYSDALAQMGFKNISKYLIYTSIQDKVKKI
tara:strand:+ start:3340 stop:6429 length:3090 start_codon:yes stop_codon:yes gene_type:complete